MRPSLRVLTALLFLFVFVASKSEYKVVSANRTTSTVYIRLQYTGNDEYYVKPTSPIIKTLLFTFHTHAFGDFVINITDASKKRFTVPQHGVFPFDPLGNFSFPISGSAVNFEYTENPFDFRVTRKQNGAVLFSTYDQNIIFSDHYLEIGTQVASEYFYGLGERFLNSFRMKNGRWSMFNRDRGFNIDRGTGNNGYGYFPFYLMREKNHLFHINYFRSSNAMDVFKEEYLGKHYITYKVIGGVFDFRFFLGEQSPETTVEKLNFYNGRALLPPFWSFGFHQCRWGYRNVSYLQNVIANYEKNGLPLDTIWTDIDYMLDYEDFTINEQLFPLDQMKKIQEKYRYIPIIDAGIKTVGSAYEEGLKRGVYVNDPYGKPFIGRVWPGQTTFVDFFHPNATQYWMDMLDTLYQKIKFDGVWLDMNQLSNFCQGACTPPTDPPIFDYSKDLPYNVGSDNIQTTTIPLNSTHYGNLLQADVHVFHSLLQSFSTSQFLRSKHQRPFVLSRSSTLGSSGHAIHWTADAVADWEFLKGSIADMLNNQLFGFQMIGADICGFGGNTTVELCSRWYQLGALYPFARSHNVIDGIDQEPYALGPIVLQSAYTNLKLRYSILKYYYTQFVNKKGLGTIWKPLFFVFPLDDNTYLDDIADSQFLIGPDIMAAPILEPNQTSRKVYFPSSNWYNLYNGKVHTPGTDLITGVELTDAVPLFLREGGAILIQDVVNVVNTKQLTNRFNIYAGFRYDSRRSNATHKVYEAIGNILSLKNYDNDTKLDLCLTETCEYIFNMVLSLGSAGNSIEIDVGYLGGRNLNEEIAIYGLYLYHDGATIEHIIQGGWPITGPTRRTIQLNGPAEQKKQVNLLTE